MSLPRLSLQIKNALLLVCFSGCFNTIAQAGGTYTATLVWLKPLESDQVMKGNTIVEGDAFNLLTFVAKQIPGVEHKFEAYPIRRSWRLIQNRQDEHLVYCFWGANYKEERENWGYFTEPTSVELPYLIAAKKDKLLAVTINNKVSVLELLKRGYSTVIFEEVSNPFSEIIRQSGRQSVVKVSGLDKDLSDHTLRMIEKGRIDFGYISYRAIANLGVSRNPHLSLYEVQELSSENLKDGRVLCSKSEAGKQIVASINSALVTIKNNESLRSDFKHLIFKTEGYPTDLKTIFEQQWDKAYINKPRQHEQ